MTTSATDQIIREFILSNLSASNDCYLPQHVLIKRISHNGFTPAQARKVIKMMQVQGLIAYSVDNRGIEGATRIIISLRGVK